MTSYLRRSSTRRSNDTMDDDTDDKDDNKRKSRNLSEKKRRDQFNMLINELSSMVSTNSRKMDKSTVLKSTISFLKNHNEIAVRSRVHEIQEEWKPSFLSNEEFTHLILEALDGFIMVFSSSGRILYTSESITSLLGHLPDDLLNMTIYDMIFDEDQSELYNMLLNPTTTVHYDNNKDNQISFLCHCKRGNLHFKDEATYELVQFVGYFRADMDSLQIDNDRMTNSGDAGSSSVNSSNNVNNSSISNNKISGSSCNNVNNSSSNNCKNNLSNNVNVNNNNSNSSSSCNNSNSNNITTTTNTASNVRDNTSNSCSNNRFTSYSNEGDTRLVFVGTGRLQTPQLIREMSIIDSSKSEFTSRHSLEWKFLFLDHRAPPIIGYLPFEVLGTSGYDYYHVDDLERVVSCHEALMQKGEGTSCYYRFLTKGQQWIWLQTRFYITYHQWNSKPEFIVCTHRVVSYANVMKQMRKDITAADDLEHSCGGDGDDFSSESCDIQCSSSRSRSSTNNNTIKWPTSSSKSSVKSHSHRHHSMHSHRHGRGGGDTCNSDGGGGSMAISSSRTNSMPSSLMTPITSQRTRAAASESTSQLAARHSTSLGTGPGSDSNSMSADSPASRQTHNSRGTTAPPVVDVQHHIQVPAATTVSYLESPTRQQLSPYNQQPQVTAIVPPPAAVIATTGYHHHHVAATLNTVATPILQLPQPSSIIEITPPPQPPPPPPPQAQPLLMTTAQIRLQDQLQRKHEQLQQNILQQQDELRRVSEQLLMARYGLLPTLINVSVPYTPSVAPVSSGLYVRSPPVQSPPTAACSVNSNNNNNSNNNINSNDNNSDNNHSNNRSSSQQIVIGSHPPVVDEVLPFQFSQQQAQLLFASGLGSPTTSSTQHTQ